MPIGARKSSTFWAVTEEPDVCLTPMGPAMVPVPYMLYTSFEGSDNCIANVRFNGKPAFVWDHSHAPRVTGDEPGTGGGVKSGVNVGRTWAHEKSGNVRAGGRRIVRKGDKCWMNMK